MCVVIATSEHMAELSKTSEDFNVTPLRDFTHNCPACILSAIRQYDDGKRHFNGFNFAEEAKHWIEDYRASMQERRNSEEGGDVAFCHEYWVEQRAKRAFTNIGLAVKEHPANCQCLDCSVPF